MTELAARSGTPPDAVPVGMEAPAGRWGGRALLDAIVLAVLFIVTVAYLTRLPPNLSPADESSYLHEAKRLLDGEVMYRDVFDFITPGFQYLMALLFALFGTTIATARAATAVIHGLTAAALYAACRRLGVRPSLAAAAGFAHLTVDQAAWPIASQHWLSTLLCTVLLAVYAGPAGVAGRGVVSGGVVLGLLADVQQQRALPMALGTAAWVVIDALIARRGGRATSLGTLASRLVLVGGAIAAVVVPVLGWCIARAGFGTVWQALVEFPLKSYGATTHCEWGNVNIMTVWQGSFTFPWLLAWLPVAFVPTLVRLARALVRREVANARRLAWPVVFAAASALSIRYFPDFIHIAFIAPVFYAALAENIEAAAHTVRPQLAGRVSATVVAVVFGMSAFDLARNEARLWREFPVPVETAFGRIRLRNPSDVELYDEVRHLTDATPGVEVFVYPTLSHLYLMTGATNPTRYSWYASTFGFADLLESIQARRPPYALVLAEWKADDPIIAYVRRNYVPATSGAPFVGMVLRRRPDAA